MRYPRNFLPGPACKGIVAVNKRAKPTNRLDSWVCFYYLPTLATYCSRCEMHTCNLFSSLLLISLILGNFLILGANNRSIPIRIYMAPCRIKTWCTDDTTLPITPPARAPAAPKSETNVVLTVLTRAKLRQCL